MKHLTASLLTLLLLTLTNCGRMNVVPVASIDPAKFAGGAYYALPMTLLTVEIPVTEITRTKIECFDDTLMRARFGDDPKKIAAFLSLKKDTTFYKLGEEITVSGRPVPDSGKLYLVNLTGNWRKNQSLTLALNEFGVVSKADVAVEDHTFDIVVQSLQSVAGIAATLTGTKGATPAGAAALSAEAKKAEQAKDSVYQCVNRLRHLNGQLNEVRKARFNLLKASEYTSYIPEPALKLRLTELNELEKQLIASMTFTEERTTYIVKRDIVIRTDRAAKALKDSALFAFTPKLGLTLYGDRPDMVDGYESKYLIPAFVQFKTAPSATPPVSSTATITASSQSSLKTVVAKPVPTTERTEKKAPDSLYYIHINWSATKQFGTDVRTNTPTITNSGSGKPKSSGSLAYNIPARATVSVRNKARSVAVANLMMPQLGGTSYLSRKASTMTVEFDPATGGLRSLTQKTTGLTGAQITSAGAALGSGVTALKKEKEAPETDLGKLQKERSLLEEQEKILKLNLSLDTLRRKQTTLTVKD